MNLLILHASVLKLNHNVTLYSALLFIPGSGYANTVEVVPGSLYWSFDHFNTSGDGRFANQNVNASDYNADPGLAVSYWYAIAGNHSIRTRKNGTGDCIDFGDFTGHCVGEPNLCTDGLTFSLWIRMTADEIKEVGPIYVVSTGTLQEKVCVRNIIALLKCYAKK